MKKIGVIQNQNCKTTLITCAVSRWKTCRLATIHPTPTANSPSTKMYTGNSNRKMLIWFSITPAAATIRPTARRWLTTEDRNTETGRISEGNTVFVIRFDWSSITVADRCTVSLKSSQGSRSEEHTSELQSPCNLVCRLLLEKKKKTQGYKHLRPRDDRCTAA